MREARKREGKEDMEEDEEAEAEAEAEQERVRCAVMAAVGQRMALCADAMEALTSLSLCGRGLSTVRLPALPALQQLHLAHNRLSSLQGLALCPRLRCLALQHNPPLASEQGARMLLTALSELSELRHVTLPFDTARRSVQAPSGSNGDWDESWRDGYGKSGEVRVDGCGESGNSWERSCTCAHVVSLLIRSNPLQTLNGRKVSIGDRMRALHDGGASRAVTEGYICHLAIAQSVGSAYNCTCPPSLPPSLGGSELAATPDSSTAAADRPQAKTTSAHGPHRASCPVLAADSLRPQDAQRGPSYDPSSVVELPDLGGLGLSCSGLGGRLGVFGNVRRLNLSHNAIRSLLGVGVAGMPHLVSAPTPFSCA